ncbi:hypothetical protein EG329_001999 [Mollisiaceae sp. DMI_Dod_QoI]|nr:hypothetical protein EG329_001999 [Helotiales sp. DMI_Dod_QoI]
MEDLFSEYDQEEDSLYQPVWRNQARIFVDRRAKEAEDFNALLECHLPDEVVRWDCIEEIGWEFEFEDLVLEVRHSQIGLVETQVTSWTMPRKYIDPLRRSLRELHSGLMDSISDMTEFAMILLRLNEEANMFLHEWKHAILGKGRASGRGWDLTEIDGGNVRDYITSNSQGADLSTIETSADDLLGTSIKNICASFPEDYRILHVEPVTRTDLVARFQKKQGEIYENLMKRSYTKLRQCVSSTRIARGSSLDRKEDLAQELCTPKVTFHGTQRRNVSSIVRYGFVKPGDKAGDKEISVACGGSYGYGVYTSPDPEYALMYSSEGHKTASEDLPGIRLIVCAVLMGLPLSVTREDTWRTSELANKTAHSHVSPNELEYIVFEAAQVIPCYVIHLDFGVEFAKQELAKVPEDPNKWVKRWRKVRDKLEKPTYVAPADIEAEKQARKAAAAKWFPYGYGPASGTSFVIEEIGETSDDEETYGDYQGMRIEVEDEVSKWEETVSSGTSWFDEYQKSRHTYRNL